MMGHTTVKLPCTVTAIKAEWTLGAEKPSITLIMAKHHSQITIHTDANDIGKSVFFREHDAYDALAKWER